MYYQADISATDPSLIQSPTECGVSDRVISKMWRPTPTRAVGPLKNWEDGLN